MNPASSATMKIGVLVIATGKYIEFVPDLHASLVRHFLTRHDLTMFVFTNHTDYTSPHGEIVTIEIEHGPWPDPSLKRYHHYCSHRAAFSGMDYLFHFDADAVVSSPIGDEVLADSVVVEHPGFAGTPGTPERRPESRAAIPEGATTNYYAGGVNGGVTARFLAMAEAIRDAVDHDASNGVTAIWHDESHLNHYCYLHPPALVLPKDYCWPEEWKRSDPPKITVLDKNLRGGHEEWRT